MVDLHNHIFRIEMPVSHGTKKLALIVGEHAKQK